MSTNYNQFVPTRRRASTLTVTPQNLPIPGREAEMVRNAAGGYSFAISDLARLNRFLILGVEGDTFYQGQKTLVKENAKSAAAAIAENPRAVVDLIVDISRNSRALKPGPCLFVLAMVAAYKADLKEPVKPKGDPALLGVALASNSYEKARAEYDAAAEVRAYALAALPKVARTAKHLYTFAEYVQGFRGWGRGLKKAFANWYLQKPVEKLAMQAWKYKSRKEGDKTWSHRDLLRLAHPQTEDAVRNEILRYMAKPEMAGSITKLGDRHPALGQIDAAEELLHLTENTKETVARAVRLITDYRLTHEAVPGPLKNEKVIWEALLQDMPMAALLWNLNKMTSIGLFAPLSVPLATALTKLSTQDAIVRSGLHPMRILVASKQYSVGHGDKGSLSWTPNQRILDALDGAFYMSFGNVTPFGGPMLVAIDDSGSMSRGGLLGYGYNNWVMGINGWTPLMAAAAWALVFAKIEPNVHLIRFSDSVGDFKFSSAMRIDGVMNELAKHHGGATNSALPYQWLLDNKVRAEAVVTITDNETWAGAGPSARFAGFRAGHPSEIRAKAVARTGPIRSINVAMTATPTSDVNPKDTSWLELTGLDADTPQLVSEFVKGNL